MYMVIICLLIHQTNIWTLPTFEVASMLSSRDRKPTQTTIYCKTNLKDLALIIYGHGAYIIIGKNAIEHTHSMFVHKNK